MLRAMRSQRRADSIALIGSVSRYRDAIGAMVSVLA